MKLTSKLIQSGLAVLLLSTLIACGGAGGTGGGTTGTTGSTDSPFAGSWTGTYSGDRSGSVDMLISKNGTFAINANQTGGGAFSASGSIQSSGSLSATIADGGGHISGNLAFDGPELAGSVKVQPTGLADYTVSVRLHLKP